MIRSILCLLGLCVSAHAQLPVITLDSVFPPGGQTGQTVELSFSGAEQDEIGQLHFFHPGLKALAPNKVEIGQEVPPGVYEVRVSGRFGLSNPRAFVVNSGPSLQEKVPNQTMAQAMLVEIGQSIFGRANADQIDWFKFSAKKGKAIVIETMAERIDSRMDSALVLCDNAGREIARANDVVGRDALLRFEPPADGDFLLQVHDFLYQGDGNQFIYQLSLREASDAEPSRGVYKQAADISTAELAAEPSPAQEKQNIAVPGEFRGSIKPSDKHQFEFSAKKGDVWIAEVFSDRLGMSSDFRLTAYKLDKDGKPAKIGDADDLPDESGHPGFPTSSRDPYFRVQADADATYRLVLENQFARDGKYHLVLRKPKPGFHIFATSENLTDPKEKVSLWTPLLRRGGTADLEVFAVRRDGFTEAIDLSVEGLPTGVSSKGGLIPAGQSKTRIVLEAAKDTATWAGDIQIFGQAKIGAEVRRIKALGATHIFTVGNVNSERYESRLTSQIGLAVLGQEDAAVSIATKTDSLEMCLAGELEIPVEIARLGEQVGNFNVSPVNLPGLAKAPSVAFDPKATEAKLKLSLAKRDNNNFQPGEYALLLKAEGGQVKYRTNPQALERAEAEKKKKDEEAALAQTKLTEQKAKKESMTKELAALKADQAKAKQNEISENEKVISEAEKALQAANQAKDAAGKAVEAAKNRANPKDLKQVLFSRPFRLKITDAPITLADSFPAVKAQPKSKVEIPISINKRYGFDDVVELELIPPKEAKGFAAAKASIAKGASEAKLLLTLGEEAGGAHELELQAKLKLNGQDIQLKRSLRVEIEKPKT